MRFLLIPISSIMAVGYLLSPLVSYVADALAQVASATGV